jgi:flagellar biosynthesis/type III secretory pathway chaperone
MATISTLAVNLVARTSAFEKGMRRGKNSVKSLKATVGGAVSTIARFAKGLAIAAGVGGMGFMLKKTLSMIDATAKLSDRIGITTEALVGLRHAANIAGVSSEALDKSLEIFVRRMGEVTTGSGEAKKGLELLGLEAETMIKLTPDKSLSIIAERIRKLGTQAEKSAAAYFLFGRAGAQLLNLFEEGADGIARLQAEAEQLGLTFSRFDAAQVEAANDAITRLQASMKGVFNEITIRLAPAIKKIADFMTKYRDSIIGTIKKTVIFVAKTVLIVKVIKLVGGAIRGLIAIYKSLAAAQTITLALGGPAGWAIIAAGVGIATVAIIGINKAIDGTISGLKGVSAGVDGVLASGLEAEKKITAQIAGRQKLIDRSPATIIGKRNEQAALAIAKTKKEILRIINDTDGSSFAEFDRKIKQQQSLRRVLRSEIKSISSSAQNRLDALVKSRDALKSQLATMIEMRKTAEATATAEKERTDRLKIEETALGGLKKFAESLQQSLDEVGLTSLEAQLGRLKKLGEELTGDAALKFIKGIRDAEKLIDDIEAKRKELEPKKIADKIPSGRFQEIRSEFIDVAALSGGSKDQKLDIQNKLTREGNEILRDIRRENKAGSLI